MIRPTILMPTFRTIAGSSMHKWALISLFFVEKKFTLKGFWSCVPLCLSVQVCMQIVLLSTPVRKRLIKAFMCSKTLGSFDELRYYRSKFNRSCSPGTFGSLKDDINYILN